jgi:cellulose synthase/poly-beta-1,6-N-acetylglucosamine synthase-like glycosyltransferase
MAGLDLEISLGKRTKAYRFFEMLPGILSYGSIILVVVLSLIDPFWATIYLLLIIITMIVKAVGIAIHAIKGRRQLDQAQKIDWHERLMQLEHASESYERLQHSHNHELGFLQHKRNLQTVAARPDRFPKPSQLYNAVIIASVNEPYEVLDPTLQSVLSGSYNTKQLIIVLAYEQVGGEAIRKTVTKLKKKYERHFHSLHLVEHVRDVEHELVGKGGNITNAGRYLKEWLPSQGIAYEDVIITTLDSDNRPHKTYFDYVTYEYIVHEDRKKLSYQPLAIYMGNIWDAPAPMRVIATGNSFWNIISSMRPHTLRNFASHSQPMDALVEMDFWSTRTVVEDGHQYWRSYFHFNGDYAVTPIYVPIYQDAVLSSSYTKTLKAQFIQLRRWAYGASDVAYVATRLFSRHRNVPLAGGLARLVRLLDGHVTLASGPILVAFGGWVPLFLNSEASRSVTAHQLPEVISSIQQLGLIGLAITIFLAFNMLPPRPARYKRRRSVGMILQWVLMPVTAVVYSAASAYNAQTRLLFARYLETFDLTEKATHGTIARAKQMKADHASSQKQ